MLKDKKTFDIIIPICLFLLALTVYLYKIDVVTPGIHPDEVAVAEASEKVLTLPEFIPFMSFNGGHSTPLLYITGTSIALFGKTIIAIRLPYIFFGALSIAFFYILLRLFFNKTVALFTSILFLFCYPFLVISRFAFEMAPSIFFQILTVIFLYFAWKSKNIQYYAAVGLSLGAGLYTYVGFRTFAFFILLITAYLLFKSAGNKRERVQKFVTAISILFLTTVPLISYSLRHTGEIMHRTSTLSFFNKNLPLSDILQELSTNISQLSHLFFFNGDPNLIQNPSQVSFFDLGTFIFFILGIFFLFKKNKKLLIVTLVLSAAPLINDVLSGELVGPNSYGLAHPNTLRIAGIIPIVFFFVAYGLQQINPLITKINKHLFQILLIAAVFIFIAYNWHAYFDQPYSHAIYKSQVAALQVVDIINGSSARTVFLSPLLVDDERIKYFTKKGVLLVPYTPLSTDNIFASQYNADLVIIDWGHNPKIRAALLQRLVAQPELFHGLIVKSPDDLVEAFVLEGKNR